MAVLAFYGKEQADKAEVKDKILCIFPPQRWLKVDSYIVEQTSMKISECTESGKTCTLSRSPNSVLKGNQTRNHQKAYEQLEFDSECLKKLRKKTLMSYSHSVSYEHILKVPRALKLNLELNCKNPKIEILVGWDNAHQSTNELRLSRLTALGQLMSLLSRLMGRLVVCPSPGFVGDNLFSRRSRIRSLPGIMVTRVTNGFTRPETDSYILLSEREREIVPLVEAFVKGRGQIKEAMAAFLID
ncbi:hypothetical protein LguiA_033926 [Lonicera macranthoides]